MFGRAYNWKQVLNQNRGDEVKAIVDRMGGGEPGSKTWVAKYQAALKEIEAKLSPKEIQALKDEAQEWSERSPPEDVQAK